jgi:hypothetical protein
MLSHRPLVHGTSGGGEAQATKHWTEDWYGIFRPAARFVRGLCLTKPGRLPESRCVKYVPCTEDPLAEGPSADD